MYSYLDFHDVLYIRFISCIFFTEFLLLSFWNLDNLSPTALSVLAVLTGLLLLYFGNEELESEEVRLVLQLGVAAAPALL